ncbi:hypothetical protein Tco_0656967 [Tanacetum coccineum]|uniref:Reverse transcriptase domain-containing protein n=1 Tax=Tanacetum coccineum TaxID=301880 RepID=A0ABQ4XB00_9ASTR
MDDLNITMEEYIQLMSDKARGRNETFNWETATYGKVYCEDFDSFTDFETDFPAIVYNDASTSNKNVSFEPTRRWIEHFSDYDCEIRYHHGKVNVVADALSRKEIIKPRRVRAMSMMIHSGFKTKILEAESEAYKDFNTPAEMLRGLDKLAVRKKG